MNKPKPKVLVRIAAADYKGELKRKYDAIFQQLKKNPKFKERSERWAELTSVFKFEDYEIEILAAKEDYIKAKFYDRLQKEIVTMANLSPSQQNRNRRVDLIVARISPKKAKERLL